MVAAGHEEGPVMDEGEGGFVFCRAEARLFSVMCEIV